MCTGIYSKVLLHAVICAGNGGAVLNPSFEGRILFHHFFHAAHPAVSVLCLFTLHEEGSSSVITYFYSFVFVYERYNHRESHDKSVVVIGADSTPPEIHTTLVVTHAIFTKTD